MAKKKTTHRARHGSSGSLEQLFRDHPNLKMLLSMFVLAIILFVLTYQM